MATAPFRPAREIAITARRTARHDPASYDTTAPLPAGPATQHSSGPPPSADNLDGHPGQPAWWTTFTTVMACLTAAGAVVCAAGATLPGIAISAGAAALWGLSRIAALYDHDIA